MESAAPRPPIRSPEVEQVAAASAGKPEGVSPLVVRQRVRFDSSSLTCLKPQPKTEQTGKHCWRRQDLGLVDHGPWRRQPCRAETVSFKQNQPHTTNWNHRLDREVATGLVDHL